MGAEFHFDSLTKSVAFAICRSKGHDPEQMVVHGVPYEIEGKTFAAVNDFCTAVQLWTQFIPESKAAISAVSDWIKVSS